MAIRDKRPNNIVDPSGYERFRRKANQHWDMAGEARRDGDSADEARHTALAREYEQKARECVG